VSRKLVHSGILVLILLLFGGPARATYLAAYWDENYPTHWSDWAITVEIRNYFAAAGYEILDADELKTWMDRRIADGAPSAVIFCRDVAPDTVVETNTAGCMLRRYLDAGGKIVFHGDIPFYNQGNRGGGETEWGVWGSYCVLGFDAACVEWETTWDSGDIVQITAAGQTWGLTEPWASQRPMRPYAWPHLTVLAVDGAGNAAGWAAHYVEGDTTRGFVRLFDWDDSPWSKPNQQDMQRVAQYGLGPEPADGATHPQRWVNLAWMPEPGAVSYDVYFGNDFDDVVDGTPDTFLGTQTARTFVVGMAGSPYPDGLTLDTAYYWRIDALAANGSIVRHGEVWSFTVSSPQEDFERGDFQTFPWEHRGDNAWTITSTERYAGTYSAQAGSVDHDGQSTLRVQLDCVSGDIAFSHKVSSESSFDFLRFYIDDVKRGEWSGRTDWEQTSFPVTAGTRTFAWTYSKDGSVSEGDDTAWLDDIGFPLFASTMGSGAIDLTEDVFDLIVSASNVRVLVLCFAPSDEDCHVMDRVVQQIANEYSSQARICRLNVDAASNRATQLAVGTVPTLLLFEDGQVERRWVGVTDKTELTTALDELLFP